MGRACRCRRSSRWLCGAAARSLPPVVYAAIADAGDEAALWGDSWCAELPRTASRGHGHDAAHSATIVPVNVPASAAARVATGAAAAVGASRAVAAASADTGLVASSPVCASGVHPVAAMPPLLSPPLSPEVTVVPPSPSLPPQPHVAPTVASAAVAVAAAGATAQTEVVEFPRRLDQDQCPCPLVCGESILLAGGSAAKAERGQSRAPPPVGGGTKACQGRPAPAARRARGCDCEYGHGPASAADPSRGRREVWRDRNHRGRRTRSDVRRAIVSMRLPAARPYAGRLFPA